MIGIEQISNDFIEKLKILACFEPQNLSQGIKLRSDMDDNTRQAAAFLYQQGLISEVDGGYLTPFGIMMVEHLQHLLVALKPL